MKESDRPKIDRLASREQVSVQVQSFTEAKDPERPELNEDLFRYAGHTFVLADGSTAKEGTQEIESIYGQSGGLVASQIACRAALDTNLNGPELITHVTNQLRAEYANHYPNALEDSRRRFAATLLVARLVGNEIVVTQVGDTGFRVNGGEFYTEVRLIDVLDAKARSNVIVAFMERGVPEDEAVKLGRRYIEPSLNTQHLFRNHPTDPLGFAYIDGGEVPEKFVHVHHLDLQDVRTLELVSDGYPEMAAEPTIEAWEEAYQRVQTEDPSRYKKYLATKPADDRTIAILRFGQ